MIRLLLLLTAVAFCSYCTEGPQPLDTPSHRSAENGSRNLPPAPANAPAGPAAAAAQKAAVDPDSGELVAGPAEPAFSGPQAMRQADTEASTETLDEQPSPVPGGGVMIDLKGHFRSPVSVTVDSDGDATDRQPKESDDDRP